MNQAQQGPAPYKVDSERPQRSYEVLENGDVKMTEIQKSEVYFKSREFTSFMRLQEQLIEETKKQMTPEHIKELEIQANQLLTELEPMKEINKVSEEKANIEYNKKKFEGMVQAFKNNLKSEKPNVNFLMAMEKNNEPEFMEKVWQEVGSDLRAKFALEKKNLERKGK